MCFQLKRLMSERGVNITELAKMTGIANANISNMIHGKASPNLETMKRIAKALNIEPWVLLKEPETGEEAGVLICPKCGAKFMMVE